MIERTFSRRIRRTLARVAAVLAFGAALAPAHAAFVLDPRLPGQYAPGTGADATFLRIDGTWPGTSVYWNESRHEYSNTPGDGFVLIGTLGWQDGGGLWGLVDWAAANAPNSTLPILSSWSGRVAMIDHADAEYPAAGYEDLWGSVGPLPAGLFDATGPQDNWTARYTGYLRITDPGAYNFGVLYDDGFFLRIWGAGDSMVEISSDFLSPRDRLGFLPDLQLAPGLYPFELGAYDHLQVGVVNLAWSRGDGWVTVPTENLVTEPVSVPEPGTTSLLLVAISALLAFRMPRQRR